jgi:hypothetical protein
MINKVRVTMTASMALSHEILLVHIIVNINYILSRRLTLAKYKRQPSDHKATEYQDYIIK